MGRGRSLVFGSDELDSRFCCGGVTGAVVSRILITSLLLLLLLLEPLVMERSCAPSLGRSYFEKGLALGYGR